MTKLLKILKYLGVTFVILIFIFSIPLWWSSFKKYDSYYIPDVDFQSDFSNINAQYTFKELHSAGMNLEEVTQPQFMSNYHWLKEGNGTAIIYRMFWDKLVFGMDDEIFTQVTVVVPNIKDGTYHIDDKTIKAFYTRGGSAWPRSQCGTPIDRGTIKISDIDENSFKAKIDFDIICQRRLSKEKTQISFHEERKFTLLLFSEATPWTGKKGKHIYSETYRY